VRASPEEQETGVTIYPTNMSKERRRLKGLQHQVKREKVLDHNSTKPSQKTRVIHWKKSKDEKRSCHILLAEKEYRLNYRVHPGSVCYVSSFLRRPC
jgi:hypothetical protein